MEFIDTLKIEDSIIKVAEEYYDYDNIHLTFILFNDFAGTFARLAVDSEEQYISQKFEKEIPMTEWGRIDQEKITDYKIVDDYNELLEILSRGEYYIIWGVGLPIIKCNLD